MLQFNAISDLAVLAWALVGLVAGFVSRVIAAAVLNGSLDRRTVAFGGKVPSSPSSPRSLVHIASKKSCSSRAKLGGAEAQMAA
jgi:hypothetical protein